MQNFLEGMETGYGKYKNPYHNSVHAADVLQTTFHILSNSGLMVNYLIIWIREKYKDLINLFEF